MTDRQSNWFRDLPVALLKNRWLWLFGISLAALELFNLGAIPAYITTQKGVETKAEAENAAVLKKAEALLAEQKAITEGEIASNAARKQRADARKTTADAERIDAEAVIARETARYADLKAKAEAEAQIAEAALKTQLARIEAEVAKQAARRQKAEAIVAEEEAKSQEYANAMGKKYLPEDQQEPAWKGIARGASDMFKTGPR